MKSLAVLILALLGLEAQSPKDPKSSPQAEIAGFPSRNAFSFDTSHEAFKPSAMMMKNEQERDGEPSSEIKNERLFSDFISSTSSENMNYKSNKDEYYYNSNTFDYDTNGEKLTTNKNDAADTFGEHRAVAKSSSAEVLKGNNREVKFDRLRENLSETKRRCDSTTNQMKVADYLRKGNKIITIDYDNARQAEYFGDNKRYPDGLRIFTVVTHDLFETNSKGLVEGVIYKGKTW